MDKKRVLFFKPGAIGDLLHALPALRAIQRKDPAAHITVVVSPGLEQLLQGTPVADRILVFDKSSAKRSLRSFIGYGLRLRKERFDLFVDMQPSVRSSVLRLLCGPRQSLVYRKQKQVKPGVRRLHAVENFIQTLAPLDIVDAGDAIELPLSEDALRSAERFLRESEIDGTRTLVALNCSVGAARPARNWFPDKFSELADRLARDLDAAVIFIGAEEDRELVGTVMSGMREKAVSAAGRLSLAESAALLSRCACLVSSDTGPLHLATAVGTRVIGLFGSTDPRRTGPVGAGHQVLISSLPCVPCEEKNCPEGSRACMQAIDVEKVFLAVRKAIG